MPIHSNGVTRIHQQRASIACSICGATFAGFGAAENASQQQHNTVTRRPPPPAAALTRIGLESSFVNIPRYTQPSIVGDVHYIQNDIESILDHALRVSSYKEGGSGGGGGTGANMHEASRRMDAFLESTMAILSRGSNNMTDDDKEHDQSYYCQSCLGM